MKKIPVELFVWVAGLLYVSFVPPCEFSICLFHFLGFKYCPGCGLGHAIYYFVHGRWQESLNANPIAILAIPVLSFRIFKLYDQLHFNQIKSTP